jgi:hypothetical protein
MIIERITKMQFMILLIWKLCLKIMQKRHIEIKDIKVNTTNMNQ